MANIDKQSSANAMVIVRIWSVSQSKGMENEADIYNLEFFFRQTFEIPNLKQSFDSYYMGAVYCSVKDNTMTQPRADSTW